MLNKRLRFIYYFCTYLLCLVAAISVSGILNNSQLIMFAISCAIGILFSSNAPIYLRKKVYLVVTVIFTIIVLHFLFTSSSHKNIFPSLLRLLLLAILLTCFNIEQDFRMNLVHVESFFIIIFSMCLPLARSPFFQFGIVATAVFILIFLLQTTQVNSSATLIQTKLILTNINILRRFIFSFLFSAIILFSCRPLFWITPKLSFSLDLERAGGSWINFKTVPESDLKLDRIEGKSAEDKSDKKSIEDFKAIFLAGSQARIDKSFYDDQWQQPLMVKKKKDLQDAPDLIDTIKQIDEDSSESVSDLRQKEDYLTKRRKELEKIIEREKKLHKFLSYMGQTDPIQQERAQNVSERLNSHKEQLAALDKHTKADKDEAEERDAGEGSGVAQPGEVTHGKWGGFDYDTLDKGYKVYGKNYKEGKHKTSVDVSGGRVEVLTYDEQGPQDNERSIFLNAGEKTSVEEEVKEAEAEQGDDQKEPGQIDGKKEDKTDEAKQGEDRDELTDTQAEDETDKVKHEEKTDELENGSGGQIGEVADKGKGEVDTKKKEVEDGISKTTGEGTEADSRYMIGESEYGTRYAEGGEDKAAGQEKGEGNEGGGQGQGEAKAPSLPAQEEAIKVASEEEKQSNSELDKEEDKQEQVKDKGETLSKEEKKEELMPESQQQSSQDNPQKESMIEQVKKFRQARPYLFYLLLGFIVLCLAYLLPKFIYIFYLLLVKWIKDLYLRYLAKVDLNALIICTYRNLRFIFTKRGIKTDKWMSPQEAVSYISLRFDWSKTTLAKLTDVFEKARYSKNILSEKDVDECVNAYNMIKQKVLDGLNWDARFWLRLKMFTLKLK